MVESILSRGDGVIDGRAELMAKGAAESKGTAYLWQQVDAEGMAKAMGEVFPPKEEAALAGQMDTTGNNDLLPSKTDSTLDNCMEGAYTTISTGERIALEINGQGLIQSELIVV